MKTFNYAEMKVAYWKKQTDLLAQKNAALEAKLLEQNRLLKRLASENQRLGERVVKQRQSICAMDAKADILTPPIRQRFFSARTRLHPTSFNSETERLLSTHGQHRKAWR